MSNNVFLFSQRAAQLSEAIRLVVEKNTFHNFEAAYEQCPLMPGMHLMECVAYLLSMALL